MFMYHIVRSIVFPFIPLKEVMKGWRTISLALRESPRKRKYQWQQLVWSKE